MKNTNVELGNYVDTPRFCAVRIAAMFESLEIAGSCGFDTGTDYTDSVWHIRGKNIGDNRMIFAAVKRI